MKFAKFLRTPILKNMCERLLLFVSPQNTITMSGGEFGLGKTSTECILFNQMQLYNLYVSKNIRELLAGCHTMFLFAVFF